MAEIRFFLCVTVWAVGIGAGLGFGAGLGLMGLAGLIKLLGGV